MCYSKKQIFYIFNNYIEKFNKIKNLLINGQLIINKIIKTIVNKIKKFA